MQKERLLTMLLNTLSNFTTVSILQCDSHSTNRIQMAGRDALKNPYPTAKHEKTPQLHSYHTEMFQGPRFAFFFQFLRLGLERVYACHVK